MKRCVCGKLIWGTERRAQRQVLRLRRAGNDKKDPKTLVPYVCPRSGAWHVGHSRLLERRTERRTLEPLTLLQEAILRTERYFARKKVPVIPKRLITTWICEPQNDPFTDRHREIFEHCLRSWFRLMPDYEIVVVTWGNLFDIGSSPEERKWLVDSVAHSGNYIGCSQWARLKMLQRGGGIFLDADVEALERFDPLLHWSYTLGHLGNGQTFANNAVMAVEACHPFLADQLAYLKRCDPRDPDFGNATGPFMVSNLLKARGWDGADRDAMVDGVSVRRSKVFYPYTWNEAWGPEKRAADTLAVHHWASAWKKPEHHTTQQWRAV